MGKSFEFLFDVGAPNAYLAHKVLPEFCAQTDSEVVYRPMLIGGVFKATGNRMPMVRYADAPAKLNYEMLEFRRFVEKHKLSKFRMNPHFPVNSLLAMRVITGAQDSALFAGVVDNMMRGMWEDGLDLAQPDVIADALDKAGLDGPMLIALAEDPAVKARLVEQTDAAVARGVFGAPTFFVGDEMFWGKERLGQLAEALAS